MSNTRHVIALSMPIVYTLDGEYDPDGMLFCLAAHRPLLNWAHDRFDDDDQRLPRLHLRRQRVQLVLDAFARLELMLDRLHHGVEEDQELLAELLRREHLPEYGEADDRHELGSRRRSGRAAAVRTNVLGTLNELTATLTALGDTDGPAAWVEPEGPIRVVTRSSEQRRAWAEHWRDQLPVLDRAIEAWFSAVEADPARRFDADRLATESGMSAARVKQLLLNDHSPAARGRGSQATVFDRFNPMKPIPLVEPLVLRTTAGAPVTITVENSLRGRRLGFHLQGDGLAAVENGQVMDGVQHGDGARIGTNPDSTIEPGDTRTFRFRAEREGVWPINDLADARGSARGTNAHGLFGALIVEPRGTIWRDPISGETLSGTSYDSGLYVDVIHPDEPTGSPEHQAFVDFHSDDIDRSFREFTIFMHDEPEIHSGLHTAGEHSVMPLSYRAEPMPNRLPHRIRRYAERTRPEPKPDQIGVDRTAVTMRLGDELDEQFWTARTPDGQWLERIAGEEQHHSSWLFGEPVTPVLRAYRGDPARIRLVHAGVKETHVFHLHVHQWRSVPQDVAAPSVWGSDPTGRALPKGSQLLDSITIGPQTAFTIDPLYGSGSRQHAVGDIIWHCHLYPHFHHGMWGLWRSFDRLVDGSRAYPDGTPCPALQPLPGRLPEPSTVEQPGFPWFIDGDWPMKSPPPPAALPEQRNGRRLLLQLPLASERERAAMAPACRDGSQPGALFVDLDAVAETANARAGLPSPRVVSYDVEVLTSKVQYNSDGWHDPVGHHYRLLRAEIKEVDAEGNWRSTRTEVFPSAPSGNPEPFYPRANHGDIVELRLHNALGSLPADSFDLGQLPVECGLHVHLVKFDPLAADGSCSGWNYLSGASCREAVGSDHPGEQRTVSLHRWVVDEEFGPCFFHDHLLANFRQKHGLFAALIAEPLGSQWLSSDDQTQIAWSGPRAMIVPPSETGLPAFREAALAIGDFVPLLDRGGRALNPPSTLSGDDDPGAMAINYRCAPLTLRGDDPSQWFTGADPDTPVIEAYPSERLRLRLIQGSHEEQHSFMVHGLRWRKDWGNPHAPLTNQQTIGISEAFTLDIDPTDGSPYGPGDHLWMLSPMDDLWLGCWGLVRVLRPTAANRARFAPLADLDDSPRGALTQMRKASATPPRPARDSSGQYPPNVRTYVVVARRTEHRYSGEHLTDPWGLHWQVAEYRPGQEHQQVWSAPVVPGDGPLVLRALRGDWVRVIVVNELLRAEDEFTLEPFGVEPSPPRLPLEHLDDLGRPDRRTVSPRVSLHASLLSYDVASFDGSYVGRNLDGTVAPASSEFEGMAGHTELGAVVHRDGHSHAEKNWTEQWWYADEHLAPASYEDGPGTVCYLYDLADVRNHRHHGLVGALVVEPGDVQPFSSGSSSSTADGWMGIEAELRTGDGSVVAQEAVVFVQDGLRFFIGGHPDLPAPDVVPLDDPEDSGHKAINYRSALLHRGSAPYGPDSATTCGARVGVPLWLRVVGAGDKPRQHTLTMHGLAWPSAPWVPKGPWVGAMSGIAPGTAETCVVMPEHAGDHCLRTGAFRWGTELGVWGTLRVR